MIKSITEGDHCYELTLKEPASSKKVLDYLVSALERYAEKNGLDTEVLTLDTPDYRSGDGKGIMLVRRDYKPTSKSSLSVWYRDALVAYDLLFGSAPSSSYKLLRCKEREGVTLPRIIWPS